MAALALCCSILPLAAVPVSTTLYVGKNFEIRDHDQPIKYVFNGSSRVAEIIGSLSANLRLQRLRLFPGWNLCSLAVSGPFPASGAEAISAAYQWNSGTGDYSQITLGQSLAAGTVLWIRAGTNADVSVLGAYSDPTPQPVQAGGAYFPGAGLEVWSPALPDATSSWDFDASTGQWSNHLAGDLASVSSPPPTLSPGQAFYLQSAAAASLEVPDPALRIRYYHEDHLGSSSVITDTDGALVEETAFYPFGIPRNESEPRQVQDPYQFTQKERDRETGLHYFAARYLAGSLARFVTVDLKYASPDALSSGDLASFLSNPQQINLYAYVRNNPLNLVDPTGMDGNSPSPEQSRPKVIVIYGHDMYEDFRSRTGVSRAAYEKALKGAYEPERRAAGENAEIIVKYVESKKELERTFKGSSYNSVIFDTHAYLNQKGLILKAVDENTVEDVRPEDLQSMVEGAKTAPKAMYFYGCNTSKTGFARDVSERLGSTEVTGSANEISQGYSGSARGGNFSIQETRDYNVTYSGGQETKDARKVDVNNFTSPLKFVGSDLFVTNLFGIVCAKRSLVLLAGCESLPGKE